MSIFGAIMRKSSPRLSPPLKAPPARLSPVGTTSPAAPSTSALSQTVDIETVLTAMAAEKDGGGNWQTSIVDLLKLLDLDFQPGSQNLNLMRNEPIAV